MADPEKRLRGHLAELKKNAKEYANGKEKKGFFGGTNFNKLLAAVKEDIEKAWQVWESERLPDDVAKDDKFGKLMESMVRIRKDLDAADPNDVEGIKRIMLNLLAAFKQM